MYPEEEFLQISGIQHFSFCRRQWALIHIEQQWVDNVFTANGSIEHQRVHNSSIHDFRNGIITKRGMKIHSSILGVSGECDAVEFAPSNEGISLFGKQGYWDIMPVEYKHGKPKIENYDKLQVTLQSICLEEMFSYHITKASVFYFETRRREYFEITEQLRNETINMVNEMHSYMDRGYTPKVRQKSKCKNCSLKEICIPSLNNESVDVEEYMQHHLEET